MKQKVIALLSLILILSACNSESEKTLSNSEIIELAKQATIYGYPIVEDYRVFYQTTIDTSNVSFRSTINTIYNNSDLLDASYVVVQAPNGDTFYSHLRLDLRLNAYILELPEIEPERYYSAQVLDMYTQTETALGTRLDGNNGGRYLITGPNWKGDKPSNIARVVKMDTEFAYVHYRIQVYDPSDAPKVREIQNKLSVEVLPTADVEDPSPRFNELEWLPITKDSEKDPENYFNYLNQQLVFIPPYPEEAEMRENFERLGIIPGAKFSFDSIDPELASLISEGHKQGIATIRKKYETTTDSKTLFGNHEELGSDYLSRAAGQMVGLYGLPKEESVYSSNTISTPDLNYTFNSSDKNFILKFEKGQLPPANAFWSVTLYDGEKLLFVDNPIDRYLINSPMLEDLKFNKDGSLTIYIQKERPGATKDANWLPAPDGSFFLITRIYMPRDSVLNNTWAAPQAQPVSNK